MTKWAELSERERDAWLAEKVMDMLPCVFRETGRFSGWATSWECEHVNEPQRKARCFPTNKEAVEHPHSPLAHYSTDPAAALQLAEKMREKRWAVTLKLMPGWIVREGYSVGLLRAAGQRIIIAGDTLSEAMAHACFVALGGER